MVFQLQQSTVALMAYELVIDPGGRRHPYLQFAVLNGNDLDGAAALLQEPAPKDQGKADYSNEGSGNPGCPHKCFLQQQQQQQQQQQEDRHSTPCSPFTRVFVDISGQAPLSLIVPLLLRWLSFLRPHTAVTGAQLVVKNRALYR
uniref:Uncharacterized protein n=1 Tax=Dunaliella tertiolecta TaxID=3047 RepID=A0A7S3R7S4_DUNTE